LIATPHFDHGRRIKRRHRLSAIGDITIKRIGRVQVLPIYFLSLFIWKIEKEYVTLRRELIKQQDMETGTEKKQNFILRLLECKKELRDCIQNGANPDDMKQIADRHGFKFATPI
jgi:hypothetical protein